MKRPLLHQLASISIAFGIFFCATSPAQAATFNPPQQYTYPGLTFEAPLTYNSSFPEQTTAVTFSSEQKLTISQEDTQKPLEEIVLTPTITYLDPTETVTQPTPTLSLPQTQADTPEPTVTPPSIPTSPLTTAPTTPNYTPVPQANPGGLNADTLFSMVNAYRSSHGLPALQEDPRACTVAQERAPQIAGEIASGNMHAGLKALALTYWNTENIISMNSEQAAFDWWINDPIHHDAIVGNYTYSCVACSGNSCAEEFTNFQTK